MKAIIFARCSTIRQEIDSQVEETKEYAHSLGYKNEDIDIIAEVGASAAKLNELYRSTIDRLFKMVETGKYEAVICWHINRLCRDDEWAMKIKKTLVKNKIQLYIKEPTITLLNPDGTLNTGAELAFSLFATMAKQQAEELRKKSSRGLQRNIELKKYTGGKILYGYNVDEQGFTHIDKETGKIIKEIFEEYASNKWSYKTLQKEINARYGLDYTIQWYRQKLGTEHYYNGHGYDPIITKELYDKCLEIRSKKDKQMKQKYNTFANRILRCGCGRGYTTSSSKKEQVYRCSRCHEGEQISTANLDGLLWLIASNLEATYLQTTDTDKELRQKQAVLEQKIKALDKYTSKAEKARQRAKEAYLNGVIDLEEYQDRIKKTEIDAEQARKDKERMEDEVRQLQTIIEAKGGKVQRMVNISGKLNESTLEEMNGIVRKWVKKITINGGVVTIETLTRTYKVKYNPKSKNNRWTTTNGNTITAPKIDHYKNELIKPSKVDQQTLVNTLAWIGGSEII